MYCAFRVWVIIMGCQHWAQERPNANTFSCRTLFPCGLAKVVAYKLQWQEYEKVPWLFYTRSIYIIYFEMYWYFKFDDNEQLL